MDSAQIILLGFFFLLVVLVFIPIGIISWQSRRRGQSVRDYITDLGSNGTVNDPILGLLLIVTFFPRLLYAGKDWRIFLFRRLPIFLLILLIIAMMIYGSLRGYGS